MSSADEWRRLIMTKIDDLVTVLFAMPEIREAYDTPFEVLFAVCVEAVTTYIVQWAEMDSEGSLSSLVIDADDLENPERANDPRAKLETLSRLMILDSLLDNVRHRLGLPEWENGEDA
jgi:hypothetical protein